MGPEDLLRLDSSASSNTQEKPPAPCLGLALVNPVDLRLASRRLYN